jgi:Uma2 family endonuclease
MTTAVLDPTTEELDNADLYEIIDGVRVEMPPMSAESTAIASRLARLLSNHGDAQGIGEAYPEMLIRLPLTPERNRRPDVIFVPYSHWPRNRPVPPTNAWDVLPTLCVEVVSPHDLVDELTEKIDEYFRAGVTQVWVVHPRRQLVQVHDSLTEVRGLGRADTLDGGQMLPGFTLPLGDLFPEPEPNGGGA